MEDMARAIVRQEISTMPMMIILVVVLVSVAPAVLLLMALGTWWSRRQRARMDLNAFTAAVIMKNFPVR